MKKKVCLVGAFAVGKTSLVRRQIQDTFSDNYYTTIGVRIDRVRIDVNGTEIDLIVWDLHGEDRFQSVQPSYLRGAAGILIVEDLTRPGTRAVGLELERRSRAILGDAPIIWVMNKSDLVTPLETSQVGPATEDERPRVSVATSAKTGAGVSTAFQMLALAALGRDRNVG